MSPIRVFLERHFGSGYRTEMYLGIAIVILVIVSAVGYFLLSSFSLLNNEDSKPVEEWTAEDKKEALNTLHTEARQQGVPRLSAEEKLKILENANKIQ